MLQCGHHGFRAESARMFENKRPLGRRERELSEEPWDLYAQQIARGIVHPKVYEKTPSNLHHAEMLTSINEFIGGADKVINSKAAEDDGGSPRRAIY